MRTSIIDRLPLITGPGWFKTRRGDKVRVEHNTEGWLDKLPFCVFPVRGPDNRLRGWPSYTCDENGAVYPDCHAAFKDDAGYWQPDLYGNPRHSIADDIVEKV